MPTSEHKVTLRLTLRDEGETVVAEITGPAVPENGLQVFGDVVLLALEQHADNAAEAAGGLIGALRERAWEGDDVLADQLSALLATGVIPGLKPLPVNLDELAGVLEGDPAQGGGRIEVATGQVWPDPALEYGSVLSEEAGYTCRLAGVDEDVHVGKVAQRAGDEGPDVAPVEAAVAAAEGRDGNGADAAGLDDVPEIG